MKRKCLKCGNTFSHDTNVWCRNCIVESLAQNIVKEEETRKQKEEEQQDFVFGYDCDISRPRVRKKTQLQKDVKAADKAGLSYGEYMARKAKGRI